MVPLVKKGGVENLAAAVSFGVFELNRGASVVRDGNRFTIINQDGSKATMDYDPAIDIPKPPEVVTVADRKDYGADFIQRAIDYKGDRGGLLSRGNITGSLQGF